MATGWIVFALIGCVVICSGIIVAVAILRAAWAHKERESLTSSDLTALEESAVLLVEQLKTEADRGIEELDKRIQTLSHLITEADTKIHILSELSTPDIVPDASEPLAVSLIPTISGEPDTKIIIEMSEKGMTSAEIAKATGVDCAVVNFVISLGRMKYD